MSARPAAKRSDGDSPASIDEVTDELYGTVLAEFIATRARHEKQARQSDDRELATNIRALAKPSAAAWLANQLARERPQDVRQLVALGAELRDATERLAGDELRQLSRRQHDIVSALVQEAKELAGTTGQPISETAVHGLEDTLHAALSDEQAGQQLLAGRLTEAIRRSGFGDTISPDSVAPARKRPEASPRRPATTRNTPRVEGDRSSARRALREATKARDDARTHSAEADRDAEAAADNVQQLRRELARATAAASEATQRRRALATALRRAERAVTSAERRIAESP